MEGDRCLVLALTGFSLVLVSRFAEENNSICRGTTSDQLILQKSFWSYRCFQPSTKFLPLRPRGRLIDPSGSSRSDRSITERLFLSLRASRRCYWAAAWTGNFRVTHVHTYKPLHAHTSSSGVSTMEWTPEHCWWTFSPWSCNHWKQKCWKSFFLAVESAWSLRDWRKLTVHQNKNPNSNNNTLGFCGTFTALSDSSFKTLETFGISTKKNKKTVSPKAWFLGGIYWSQGPQIDCRCFAFDRNL